MSFFAFQTGDSSRAPPTNDASPLLGRFRAVPDRQRRNSVFSPPQHRRRGFGYGVFGTASEDSEDGEEETLGGGREVIWQDDAGSVVAAETEDGREGGGEVVGSGGGVGWYAGFVGEFFVSLNEFVGMRDGD